MKAAPSIFITAVLSPSILLAAPFSFHFNTRKNNIMGATQSSSSSNTALSSDLDTTNDSTVATQDAVHAPLKSSSQIALLSHHHEPYKAPTSPIHPLAHYIFLVHGWLGNDLEMGYLSESFAKCIAKENGEDVTAIDEEEEGHDAKRVKRSNSQLLAAEATSKEATNPHHPPVVVHSVKCNVGKTHDGIKKGGTRLAHEIVDFIQSDLQKLQSDAASSADSEKEGHVTYSIVGNSLGGLYARYAISLVPRQLCIPRPITNNNDATSNHSSQQKIHVHPNTFLTTATPHLGVSQHTYLPLPRIAETIIGSGMGVTGTDLFRLNSDKTGRENVIGASVRKLSGAQGVLGPWRSNNPNTSSNEDNNANRSENSTEEEVDQEMECIIRNMCLQERYLGPLRNFQRRIAYANAYRTDFQVPTETAAFLNADSNVVHTVVACRDVNVEEGKRDRDENHVPPFVVAVVTTEQQPPNLDKVEPSASEPTTPNEELLQMSQSLDALGWTKVFIDVRNRIPLPGIPKPSWRLLPFPSVLSTMLPEPDTPLDDLIHSRGFKKDSTSSGIDGASEERTDLAKQDGVTTVTSSELIQSTNAGQTVHFPMGHTVMVANSKSDAYTKLNFQGRPVMDKLAEDMLRDVLKFE